MWVRFPPRPPMPAHLAQLEEAASSSLASSRFESEGVHQETGPRWVLRCCGGYDPTMSECSPTSCVICTPSPTGRGNGLRTRRVSVRIRGCAPIQIISLSVSEATRSSIGLSRLAPVAQLVEAAGLEPVESRFESERVHHDFPAPYVRAGTLMDRLPLW